MLNIESMDWASYERKLLTAARAHEAEFRRFPGFNGVAIVSDTKSGQPSYVVEVLVSNAKDPRVTALEKRFEQKINLRVDSEVTILPLRVRTRGPMRFQDRAPSKSHIQNDSRHG